MCVAYSVVNMLPSLSGLSGNELTAPLFVAIRDDPEHVKMIAVLAYTHHWDRLVNAHLEGEAPRPYFYAGSADEYLGVFMFFAAMEDLNAATMPYNITLTESLISLKLDATKMIDPLARPAACGLDLYLRCEGRDRNVSYRKWCEIFLNNHIDRVIVGDLIMGAFEGLEGPMLVWSRMMDNLVAALMQSAEPVQSGLFNRTTTVWRTLATWEEYEAEEILARSQNRFVSTSYSEDVAMRFGWHPEANEVGIHRYLMEIDLNPGVFAIDVQKVLPYRWRCHKDEMEVLLVPGTTYRLDRQYPLVLWATHPEIKLEVTAS